MRTIQLERMALRNFKGVQSADYAFGQVTNIIGANGTGKSTIFDAYLWCLFDKDQAGNKPKVQPLDENNEVIHDLTTSVVLLMKIDGNEMVVERRLKETWSKTGECTGTKSEYLVNEVPMTQTQFQAKMSEILPLDKWFIISSIGIIPNMDQKTCRAALQQIAPAIDEKAIAAKYKAVAIAMAKGISVDELAAMTKSEKTKAQKELDSIPAQLDAQDRLRVEDDFTAVGKRIDEINAEVRQLTADIDEAKRVELTPEEIAKAEQRRKEMKEVSDKMADIEKQISKERGEKDYAFENEMRKISLYTDKAMSDIAGWQKQLDICNERIAQLNTEVDAARKRWMELNATTYTGTVLDEVCPTCGQRIPEEKIAEAAAKAEANWKAAKVQQLEQINHQGKALKAEIDSLTIRVENLQANIDKTNAMLDEFKARMDELHDQDGKLPSYQDMLDENAEHAELQKRYNALVAEIHAESESNEKTEEAIAAKVEPLKAKMESLMAERSELEKRMAQKATNERIDEERKRLLANQSTLQQAIAEYEAAEADIAGFKKEKITAVENGVSSLFRMVHWKMYEANVTNSGEKEICQAIIDGVPYEQQNTATQVNAGIDIVEAFGKAYGVEAPLFIDNAESVTDLLDTERQLIKLTVVSGAKLSVIGLPEEVDFE
ncbi:MAG: AAA family ATPase [Paludibacteraceae bacterium]|nr:AAA family ATPase [Paludibacteraceae bacterium]